MGVKMNLRVIMKNHAADPKIGFLAQLISKSNGCATAMPTAWEVNFVSSKRADINYIGRCHFFLRT